MILYPKLLEIKNIKAIKELLIEFPNVAFDTSAPVIKEGIKLIGQNYKGKTTVLQCLNYVLGNDINENQAKLNLSSVITEGENTGSIELTLLSSTGEKVISTVIFTDKEGSVKEDFKVNTPLRTIIKKSDIKAYFNYHYISANEIIRLSSTKPGRRELMKYFLYSVNPDIAQQFVDLTEKEEKAYDLRTPLNVRKDELATIVEASKLSTLEFNALKEFNNYKEALNTVNNNIQTLLSDIAIVDKKKEEIITAENDIVILQDCITENNDAILQIKKDINIKLSSLVEIEQEFNQKLSNIVVNLTGSKLKDIANVKAVLQTGLVELSNIKAIQTEKEELRIENFNIINTNYQETINKKESFISTLKSDIALVNIEDKQSMLNTFKTSKIELEEKITNATKLINKAETFKTNNENYIKVEKEWAIQDGIVKQCRTDKEEIIKSANIEVEDFEFSPDGVTLKGYQFAESSISGADRRIAAAQFTIAMNKVVKLVVLEEMESLDAEEEKRVAKFAADRGYIIISDNVIKKATEDNVVIEKFIINS